jgi:hypothetical protein
VGRTLHEAGLVRPCEARGAGAHDARRGGAGARGARGRTHAARDGSMRPCQARVFLRN